MIIFQTASTGTAGFRLQGSLLASPAPATTFRNNAYIHRLNRTLQAEMRTLSAYRRVAPSTPFVGMPFEQVDGSIDSHQSASRELVRLVIANRGIPEDRSALSFGLTRTFVQVCTSLASATGGRVGGGATRSTLVTLERHLVASYRRLIDEAPMRDVPVLEELLKRAEKQHL